LLSELSAEDKSKVIRPDLTMVQVIAAVAGNYKTNVEEVSKLINGPQKAKKPKSQKAKKPKSQ
jgi:hypothetical protein